jgi:hypothetical protein
MFKGTRTTASPQKKSPGENDTFSANQDILLMYESQTFINMFKKSFHLYLSWARGIHSMPVFIKYL